MRLPSSGLRIDNPAFPLLQAFVAYWGVTSANGAASGLTLVCADLDNHPSYVGNTIKVFTGGAWGQDRVIIDLSIGGSITVLPAFSNAAGAAQQILAGTLFVILSRTGGQGVGFGIPQTGTATTVNGTELVVMETALLTPFWFDMYIDLVNLIAGDDFTFRVYLRPDGVNFRLKEQQQIAGAPTIKLYEVNHLYGDADCDIRVTVQRNSANNRAFPYRWNMAYSVP